MAPTAKHIAKLRKDHEALLAELEAGQKEMEDGPISQERGEELDAKAEEAAELQTQIDRYDGLVKMRRTPVDPAAPQPKHPGADDDDPEAKANGKKIQGYMSLGDRFVHSKAFEAFRHAGLPKESGSERVGVPTLGRVPLTGDEIKGLPEIGPDVIIPMRDPDAVRIPEMDRLAIRDILNVSATTSPAVSYVVYTYTRAAAPVPEGELKPESEIKFSAGLAPVRTIAVWMPVTEQQLEDLPVLAGLINTDLLYDVRKTEEEQLVWGDGTGENLLGLLDPNTGVPEIPDPADGRVPSDVIEQARMGMTDVLLRGGAPNAIVMHPIDWEAVELTKGTDAQYIWTVVTEVVQNQLIRRLWGARVVESIAMQETPGTDRYLLVGDFVRGATLWDRRAASVSVGWINDQFVRNQRTIRAEERLAFGVKRPHFFAKAVTIQGSSDDS